MANQKKHIQKPKKDNSLGRSFSPNIEDILEASLMKRGQTGRET
jgi:hypothetical protein